METEKMNFVEYGMQEAAEAAKSGAHLATEPVAKAADIVMPLVKEVFFRYCVRPITRPRRARFA